MAHLLRATTWPAQKRGQRSGRGGRKNQDPGEVVVAMTCVEGVEKFNKYLQKWVGIPLSCRSLLDKLG